MGWSIGYDPNYKRDIGYGVPAVCDSPRCNTQIDRGLAYVCGGDAQGGEWGCGLFFCHSHLYGAQTPDDSGRNFVQLCEICEHNIHLRDKGFWPTHPPKRDIRTWVRWKLDHESWATWREDHPEEVTLMRKRLGRAA